MLIANELPTVVNVVGSTVARTCGKGVYLHSGPEIAVASTKAFTSQVAAMLVFTLMLARCRNLSLEQGQAVASALDAIPGKVAQYLQEPGPIDKAVEMGVADGDRAAMEGATLDYVEIEPGDFNFIFMNPNDPSYVPPTE